MQREAQLFVMADEMLVEVLGRIRDADLAVLLPPVVGVTGDAGGSLADVVDRHLRDEVTVPARLAGRPDTTAPDVGSGAADVGSGGQAAVVALSAAAVDAARAAPEDDAIRALLLRLTVVRSLVAHYVAAYLGSTACPLPEELARPLWELTAPDAEQWRATGLFRPPLAIPDLASWRDVFLRTAGHEPHPLGH